MFGYIFKVHFHFIMGDEVWENNLKSRLYFVFWDVNWEETTFTVKSCRNSSGQIFLWKKNFN